MSFRLVVLISALSFRFLNVDSTSDMLQPTYRTFLVFSLTAFARLGWPLVDPRLARGENVNDLLSERHVARHHGVKHAVSVDATICDTVSTAVNPHSSNPAVNALADQ